VDLLRYDVVDVFTTGGAYTGNPLAVVHGGYVLTTDQMQTIAAEFGLSETAFPLPATTPPPSSWRRARRWGAPRSWACSS
jgi:trans-2,3-dihydro-3-hydroxyanthranilate isomerase